jgi:hypothetical protein
MEKVFHVRVSKAGDTRVVNVAKHWATGTKKRMNTSDIAGHLGCFETTCKADFQTKMTANAVAVAAYDSIQTNRHKVAHALGPGTTLVELEKFFNDSKPVLVAIAESLGLTPAEIAALTWP